MRQYGKQRTRSNIRGHQDCTICHPETPTRTGRVRARREAQALAEYRGQPEPRETFLGYIERVDGDQLQVRVTSSDGEYATTWLPLENVPVEDRADAVLGAQVYVEVFGSLDRIPWTVTLARPRRLSPEFSNPM